MNITDGLDGLAAGLSAIAFGTFAIFSYIIGRVDYSRYLGMFYLQDSGELTVFCSGDGRRAHRIPLVQHVPGAGLHGRHRRRSRSAARLGAVAILLKSEFVLAFVGAVFVAEMMSVILQRFVFKYRKRRYGLEYARDAPRLSPSAAAPSFRGAGLDGDAGRRPVLDHRDPVRFLRPEHAQAALSHGARSRRRRCRREWLRGEIAVIGLARSGRAAAQLLARAGADVYASDVVGVAGGRRDRRARCATRESRRRRPPRPRAHRARVARRRESRRSAGRAAVRRRARGGRATS